MKSTIITPYIFQLEDNQLTVVNQDTKTPALTISSFVPSAEELSARGCDSNDDFFNGVIGPMIKEELEFDDIQVEVLKNFLEENSYFE